MSKDKTNLRLLGSPVNLSYRSKKKSDRSSFQNRPRSALQNSCVTPSESQERYRRPFSADTKESQSTGNAFTALSTELLDTYQSYPITNIKILPPTTELLQGARSQDYHRYRLDKDNGSDYGSEDTFVSLGSKIKARAQSKPRNNEKSFKCRQKKRGPLETHKNEEKNNQYKMEVNIREKSRSPSPGPFKDAPNTTPIKYESYFIPLESKTRSTARFAGFERPVDEEALAGRVSFGSTIQDEVEQAIDTYSRRLTLTKQQLSLVEEESIHDIDNSSLSHNIPSLSPEPHQEMSQNKVSEVKDQFPKNQTFINETRTYNSFYDDFNTDHVVYSNKLSSTVNNTDFSSKDSGYVDSGPDKANNRDYSLPTTSAIKKSYSTNKVEEQPKSLDSISSDKTYNKTFPLDKKSQWTEPLNHSRLLYKDFFLKKDGPIAPPQNSPDSSMVHVRQPEVSESQVKVEDDDTFLEYPSYLRNSTTKAYTSKIIEDYKKELEAINSLHELTLRDIKTDPVSPTPLNTGHMFEQHSVIDRPQFSNSFKEKEKQLSDFERPKSSHISNERSKPNYDFGRPKSSHISNERVKPNNDFERPKSSHIFKEIDKQHSDFERPQSRNNYEIKDEQNKDFERPKSSHSFKEDIEETVPTTDRTDKNILENTKSDISKVSTKELIQNYFKVKEGDTQKDYLPKNLLKYDKRVARAIAKFELYPGQKQDWNNKSLKSNTEPNISSKTVNIRNQTQKNVFTMKTPTSARIESVHNDRDIDSWMSISIDSPRPFEMDKDNVAQNTEGVNKNEVEVSETKTHTEEGVKQFDTSETKTHSEGVKHYETLETKTPEAKDQKVDVKQSPKTTETESQKSKANSIGYTEQSPTSKEPDSGNKELDPNATVLDIYTMLKEIESLGDNPVTAVCHSTIINAEPQSGNQGEERTSTPKDSYTEIFEFLEQVEQSATEALSVVTTTAPTTVPKLEQLIRLAPTELAQRLVTASLQLDERSCCIALLQDSLANHKEQMIQKVSNLEKQCQRNISRVKQECEETVKRHQTFIDQLINDKKTLNHRIEQLVDERRALEERWKRSAQALEERYKLELRNQRDKMAASQQVARQRWVRQKAEKIKELTVKGLEGELREMAERQQKEVSDLKMTHAETIGRAQARHNAELEELRNTLQEEKEAALLKERQMASARMEKQILELELTYQEQRTRLVADMRAENERVASTLSEKERALRHDAERWKEEQEKLLEMKRAQMGSEIAHERERLQEQMQEKQKELELKFEASKKEFESQQQVLLKKKVTELSGQLKQERDREIEKAIECMEAEAQAGRRELQEALRRNKEQYECELRELAATEQATLRRYQDAQARVRHTEDRCAEYEVQVGQLETRNKVITEKNTQLEQQLEEIRDRCNAAWKDKIDNLTKEMEIMKKTHDEQMHQLYAKVKVAVARKDSAIQALTREAAKYQEKIALLEQKLAQQRKDFLKHK